MAGRESAGNWLRRRVPALVAAVAAALLAAWLAGFAVHTAYQATVTLQLQIPPASTGGEGGDPLSAAIMALPTYARLAQTAPVLGQAMRAAAIGGDPAALAGNVAPQIIPNTNLLQLQVYDADPLRAARLANSLAAALIAAAEQNRQATVATALAALQQQIDAAEAEASDLTTRLAGTSDPATRGALQGRLSSATALDAQLRGAYSYYSAHAGLNTQQPLLRVAEAAVPPREPISSASGLTLLLVAAVALVLALGTLLALDRLDTRLRSADDLRAVLDWPLLALIPPEPGRR